MQHLRELFALKHVCKNVYDARMVARSLKYKH